MRLLFRNERSNADAITWPNERIWNVSQRSYLGIAHSEKSYWRREREPTRVYFQFDVFAHVMSLLLLLLRREPRFLSIAFLLVEYFYLFIYLFWVMST